MDKDNIVLYDGCLLILVIIIVRVIAIRARNSSTIIASRLLLSPHCPQPEKLGLAYENRVRAQGATHEDVGSHAREEESRSKHTRCYIVCRCAGYKRGYVKNGRGRGRRREGRLERMAGVIDERARLPPRQGLRR